MMDDKQLAKLIRKNAEKAEKLAKARSKRFFDPALEATAPPPEDEDVTIEREHFFKEMKRREF
jgi:hypothetical protein